MSYTQLYYHIVIRTHCSHPTIKEEYERELYNFIYSMCKNRDVELLRIGGMPDHLHLFVALPSLLPVGRFVQVIKQLIIIAFQENLLNR